MTMEPFTNLVLAIGEIPIPNFPGRESVASPGFVSLALSGATILTILYFTYYYFNTGIIRSPEISILRRSTFLSALFLICLFSATMSIESDKKAYSAALDRYDDQLAEISDRIYVQIEEKYSIILEFRNYIPDIPDSTHSASDYIAFTITRPDVAGQPCYLAAPEGFYIIRCGGDNFDDSTDLIVP